MIYGMINFRELKPGQMAQRLELLRAEVLRQEILELKAFLAVRQAHIEARSLLAQLRERLNGPCQDGIHRQ